MNENNLHKELLALADWARSERTTPDFLGPVSVIILLLWAESHTQENSYSLCGARLDHHTPSAQPSNTIKDLLDLQPINLKTSLNEHLVAAFGGLGENGLGAPLGVAARSALGEETSGELLTRIIRIFSHVTLRDDDSKRELREIYDFLISRAVTQDRSLSEFTTPESVSDLLVELLAPRPGERIYDPCVGFAGLLIRAAEHMIRSDTAPNEEHVNAANKSIVGCDINPYAFLIGFTRLLLSGLHMPSLSLGDALNGDASAKNGAEVFDCVVAHPPFGYRIETDRLNRNDWRFPTEHIESAFLQHIMLLLRPGGRAALLVPNSLLFRGGSDRDLRRWLLEKFSIEGLISLPAGCLMPYTGIESTILFFRKAEPRKSIWFQKAGLHERTGSKVLIDASGEAVLFQAQEPGDTGWFVPATGIVAPNHDLVVRRHGFAPLKQLLDKIRASNDDVEVKNLGDFSRIFKGRHLDSQNIPIPEGRAGARSASGRRQSARRPFVRVGDIHAGSVRMPTDSVSAHAIADLPKDRLLRTGDIILSRISAKGRIAVVPQELDGAVPSANVCVVRPRRLLSAYLRFILASEPYARFIDENARGAGVGHLSVRAIRDLPIPIPPRKHQVQASRELPEHATREELLDVFLSERKENEVAAFITGSSALMQLAAASRHSDAFAEGSDIIPLINEELRPLRSSDAGQNVPQGPGSEWLLQFVDMVSDFSDALGLPHGAERMAFLSDLKQRAVLLLALERDIGERLESRIRRLSTSFRELLDRETNKLLSQTRLAAHIEPTWIETAKPVDVTFTIQNVGPLAIRQLSVHTQPMESESFRTVLQSGDSVSWTARTHPRSSGKMSVLIFWKALRFDREVIQGEIPLVIEVGTLATAAERKPLGASPYVVGRPVDTVRDFYGRGHVIADIKRQLGGDGPSNVILFEGIRRSGKTSVLKYMIKQRLLERWLPAYFSFQSGEGDTGKEGISTREIYLGISRQVLLAALRAGHMIRIPDGEDLSGSTIKTMRAVDRALDRYFSQGQPFRSFETLMLTVLERIKPLRLLLMLDEFDKLQVSIDNGLASPQVPENLRSLLHSYPDINAILTGSKRLRHLRHEYMSVLFGLGYAIRLDPLDDSEARRLIEEPVASDLIYADAATARMVEWCAGQPFLIQSLCNRIFESCARSGHRTVTLDVVETAATEMVRDNEHFLTLWDHTGSDKRRFILLTLRRLSDEAAKITHDLILSRLERSGVSAEEGESLGDSLEYLQELELVAYSGSEMSGSYGLAIPLMRLWLDRHIDFEDYRQRAQRELER